MFRIPARDELAAERDWHNLKKKATDNFTHLRVASGVISKLPLEIQFLNRNIIRLCLNHVIYKPAKRRH